MFIGVTERGDPAHDFSWTEWVYDNKPAILITKNPVKICEVLSKMSVRNVIVHANITGFGGSIIEPNVLKPDEAILGYWELIKLLGTDRVVLRVDPVVPTVNGVITAKAILHMTRSTRTRISFIDLYDHVKERFKLHSIDIQSENSESYLPWNDFHAPLSLRKKVWEELGKPEVCGEPGFECLGCVSKIDCKILGVDPIDGNKGQRPYCACVANKKELLIKRGQCPHGCLYCYWK